jgi:SAM-dependent methyltransferase
MQDPRSYDRKEPSLKFGGSGNDDDMLQPIIVEDLPWEDGERILDYGCGTGSKTKSLILPKVRLHPESHIYAVDISPSMISFAKKHNPSGRITYAVGNLMGRGNVEESPFPFRKIKFNKIFAINVLHHMSSTE